MKYLRSLTLALALCAAGAFSGCGNGSQASSASPSPTATPTPTTQATPAPSASVAALDEVPTYTYEVVKTYPHDTTAFTEGLEVVDGKFIESTGLEGKSTLRRVAIETGKVEQKAIIPSAYFGEGITQFKDTIYGLTYKTQVGFTYDPETFARTSKFNYKGEGWGMTHDDKSLIKSNGTDKIEYVDPETLTVTRTVSVTNHDAPQANINELEYIDGEIWANIWQTDFIVRINPTTGKIVGWIDMSNLLPPSEKTQTTDVLNGIARDPATGKIYVTGKFWPHVYEIKLKKL